ncbi:Ankrd6 [Symbiodinium sp. CCMP2592]|nr:Ankrd6 [Symbiodinium sp. CCMP2592]
MLASSFNHPEIVKLLLEASAQVNFADECGWTALMNATINGHAQVMQLLLEACAQTDPVNDMGQTAMDLAMEHSRIMRMQPAGEDQNEVCRLLMQAEALVRPRQKMLKEEA